MFILGGGGTYVPGDFFHGAIDDVFASLAAEPTPADGLVVTAVRPTGERVTVRFDEGRIAVKGTGLSAEYARAFREKMSIGANALGFDFSGYRYRVPVTGELTATERGYRLTGDEIVLDLAGGDRGQSTAD